jgi:hypothetical protein
MSGVFQNIDPPTLAGWRGGGGSIFWKTPDTALYSTDVNNLWGHLRSIKCLFKGHLSLLPSPHSFFLFVVLEISRQIQMCSTNKRDLPHSTPFPL